MNRVWMVAEVEEEEEVEEEVEKAVKKDKLIIN